MYSHKEKQKYGGNFLRVIFEDMSMIPASKEVLTPAVKFYQIMVILELKTMLSVS